MTVLFFATVALTAACASAQEAKALKARFFTAAPAVDGDAAEWAGAPLITLRQPDVPDLRVSGARLGYTADALYATAEVEDRTLVNTNTAERLAAADCFELRVFRKRGTAQYLRLFIAPTSAGGAPAARLLRVDAKTGAQEALDGFGWACKRAADARHWTVEARIPADAFGAGAEEPFALGEKLPFVMIVWDRDSAASARDEWDPWHKRAESSSQKAPHGAWPEITLADAAAKEVRQVRNGLRLMRHDPCNLFTPGEPLEFSYTLGGMPAGRYTLTAKLTDAFGAAVADETLGDADIAAGDGAARVLSLTARPGRGYYELTVKASNADAEAEQRVSLGVMERPGLDGKEFLAQNRRFGIKWWGGVEDKEETVRMLEALGLQWTRTAQTDHLLNTNENLAVVLKIERFGKELYDEAKYGPIAEYEAEYGRGSWTLKTIPKKKEYQEYLAQSLRALPPSRAVFEIWNEAWDKLNAEDFTTICQMVREVVERERPGAELGPNLRGDMSVYGYDYKVWEAGGMDGMNMVCLHPYGAAEDRAFLRAYRKWISKLCGRPIAVYITEYGAGSTPEGPARQSEVTQAQRVIQQSLALYAEGMKALIPHWVGQSENNRTYHEDWFGYIRKNQQPKPALLALANCARLIDGGEYLGDLWLGAHIGAMAFRKDGRGVLALYADRTNLAARLQADAESLTLTDMFGRERSLARGADGAFTLALDDSVVYLTGLPDAAFAAASKELRADRFPKPAKPPRITRAARRPAREITTDGDVSEWAGACELYIHNPKVNGDDASGSTFITWDADFLRVAVRMRDNEMLNKRARAKLYQQDSVELFVSTEPRDGDPGHGPNDYQFFLCPDSGEGGPVVGWVADREKGEVADVPGAEFAFKKLLAGWSGEVAIPWAALGGFKAAAGGKLALEMRVNDADTSHERWKLDPTDVGAVNVDDPSAWSFLMLE